MPEGAKTDVNGFKIAISYFILINKYFKIGGEPGFVRRGAACFPGWQPVFVGESKVFLNYIELPFMVQYKTKLSKSKVSLYTNAGYGVSFLQFAFQIQDNPRIEPITTKIDLDDRANRFKTLDHGLYGSIGFDYSLGKVGQILLESNLYFGLFDYDKIDTAKNRSLSFRVGYAKNIDL